VDVITASSAPVESLLVPPAAPRPISEKYVWRLLSNDGWWVAALVFAILGGVFGLVGAGLTIMVITAFVGIPFLFLGVIFLGVGGWVFAQRYQQARKIVDVLQIGDATQGKIVEVQENYSVTVNGRHPWTIRYQFQANGQDYQGSVTTLNAPGPALQVEKAVYVLFLRTAPKWSSIYPHP